VLRAQHVTPAAARCVIRNARRHRTPGITCCPEQTTHRRQVTLAPVTSAADRDAVEPDLVVEGYAGPLAGTVGG
jgi:hypothetical protein